MRETRSTSNKVEKSMIKEIWPRGARSQRENEEGESGSAKALFLAVSPEGFDFVRAKGKDFCVS